MNTSSARKTYSDGKHSKCSVFFVCYIYCLVLIVFKHYDFRENNISKLHSIVLLITQQ